MSIFEIVLTLIISLGAVIWGVNIYNQKGTWFLWLEYHEKRRKGKPTMKKRCAIWFGRCVVFCGIGAFLLLYGSLIIMMLFYVLDSE